MSRRKTKKKKGINPLFAIVALLGSVAYVTKPMWSGGEDTTGLASLIGLEEEPDMGEEDDLDQQDVDWQDLLAVHGSFQGKSEVRTAFSLLSGSLLGSAPWGESANPARTWAGEDPPLLRLGVLMITEHSRRAVLDGRIVGVGDTMTEGRVLSIEPGMLRLRWRERVLTYDLDGVAPREFRAEWLRRQAKRRELSGANDADSPAMATTEENQ